MRIELHGLPEGDAGIDATVEKMKELILEGTQTRMFSGLSNSSYTLPEMFHFAQKQVMYKKDPVDAEMVRRADYTVMFGTGDCDDKTIVLATLIRSRFPNAKMNIVVGACRRGSDDYSHVWLEVYSSDLKKFIPLDPTPTWSKIGWEPKHSRIKKYPF